MAHQHTTISHDVNGSIAFPPPLYFLSQIKPDAFWALWRSGYSAKPVDHLVVSGSARLTGWRAGEMSMSSGEKFNWVIRWINPNYISRKVAPAPPLSPASCDAGRLAWRCCTLFYIPRAQTMACGAQSTGQLIR